MSQKNWKKKVFGIILLVPIAIAGYTYLVMLLWNWLMPAIFSVSTLSFFETMGVILLFKLIFGFGGGYRGKWNKNQHCANGGNHWKYKMKEKFAHMSEQEKQAWKEKMWVGKPFDTAEAE